MLKKQFLFFDKIALSVKCASMSISNCRNYCLDVISLEEKITFRDTKNNIFRMHLFWDHTNLAQFTIDSFWVKTM